ncbi:uncharacterized protein B0H64DRAFT_33707 [Chaetomium fimeti]|uniref:Uncharacterized protein n=1 Tax=Chaetomium fimeti TaxID=1854472 RepID=A0AAE0HRD4_9PEZI|nr:hypothetical protein B0H64DRAFT_33707 [Chaetomium fimeti]
MRYPGATRLQPGQVFQVSSWWRYGMGLWGKCPVSGVVRYGGVRSKFRCPGCLLAFAVALALAVAEAATPHLAPTQRQANDSLQTAGFICFFSPHNRQNRDRRGRRGFRRGRQVSATRQAPGQQCWDRGDEDVIPSVPRKTQPWVYVCASTTQRRTGDGKSSGARRQGSASRCLWDSLGLDRLPHQNGKNYLYSVITAQASSAGTLGGSSSNAHTE